MPDRPETLTKIASVLREQANALQGLTQPGDQDLPIGMILLVGWTWTLSYHLLNGIRHLRQDTGAGYAITSFVRSSWATIIGSLVLTVLIWAWVLLAGGIA